MVWRDASLLGAIGVILLVTLARESLVVDRIVGEGASRHAAWNGATVWDRSGDAGMLRSAESVKPYEIRMLINIDHWDKSAKHYKTRVLVNVYQLDQC